MSRRPARNRRRQTASVAVDLSGAIFEANADVANVTKDGSNLIGQLNDLSGNARHATQGTGGNKPLWVDNQYASIDGCQFDTGGSASKRVLKTGLGSIFSNYEWTILAILKADSSPIINNQHNIVNLSSSTSGRGGVAMGVYSTSLTRRISMLRVSDAASGAATFGTMVAGTWELWTVRVAGTSDGGVATVTARVNGVAQSVSGTMYSNIVEAYGSIIVGPSISSGNSSMLYLRAWNRALDDASIASAEAAANTTFGIY